MLAVTGRRCALAHNVVRRRADACNARGMACVPKTGNPLPVPPGPMRNGRPRR
jgi:hypothetical protein